MDTVTKHINDAVKYLGMEGMEAQTAVGKQLEGEDIKYELKGIASRVEQSVFLAKIAIIRHCPVDNGITQNERRALKLIPFQHLVTNVEYLKEGFKITNKAGDDIYFHYRVEYKNFITKANHRWYFGRI